MDAAGGGRLGERALERVHAARASQGAVSFVVAALVLVRLVAFVLSQVFAAAGNADALHLTNIVSNSVSTLVDVVVLFVVLLLFDSIRRIDRESDRIQGFMDNVYRRRL